jgi:hypothetical protein
VHVRGVATNPRFVNDHVAGEQAPNRRVHRLANAVQHVPRATRADSILALNFTGRKAILCRAHLEYHHDPDANRNLGGVHDGAGQYRELLFARSALPHATLRQCASRRATAHAVVGFNEENVRALAVSTPWSVAPTHVFEVGVGVSLTGNFDAQTGKCCAVHKNSLTRGCDIENPDGRTIVRYVPDAPVGFAQCYDGVAYEEHADPLGEGLVPLCGVAGQSRERPFGASLFFLNPPTRNSAPGGIRTHNLCLTKNMLCPIELQGHSTDSTWNNAGLGAISAIEIGCSQFLQFRTFHSATLFSTQATHPETVGVTTHSNKGMAENRVWNTP